MSEHEVTTALMEKGPETIQKVFAVMRRGLSEPLISKAKEGKIFPREDSAEQFRDSFVEKELLEVYRFSVLVDPGWVSRKIGDRWRRVESS